MTVSEFFDRLDEMIGAAKIAEMRAFIGPFREQFLTLENKAEAKSNKAKQKDFGKEIESLQTELEKARAAAHLADKSFEAERKDLKAQVERLEFEKGRFRQETEALRIEIEKFENAVPKEEQAPKQYKPVDLGDYAKRIILELFNRNQAMHVEQIATKLNIQAGRVRHYLDEMEEMGLVETYNSFNEFHGWGITRKGRAEVVEGDWF